MEDRSKKSNTGDFPETRWSLVLRAQQDDSPGSTSALEEICSRYWYPIYVFLRSVGRSPADAEDLTQSFFENILAHDSLKFANPAKGKLRSFFLANLKRVATDEFRRNSAKKRGGDVPNFSLNDEDAEERFQLDPKSEDDPAKIFDRSWARELMGRAMMRLREVYEKKGRSEIFKELEPFLGWNEAEGGYKDAAANLGLKESAVRVHVFRMRQRLRSILEEEVVETLADPDDLEEEIRYLLMIAGSD